MDSDEDDDSHMCIKCKSIINGLDNYIKHRKAICGKRHPSSTDATATDEKQAKQGADVFFQSLELQSSVKKSETVAGPSNPQIKPNAGVLTRRATAAIIAITDHPLEDHIWVDEFLDESENSDDLEYEDHHQKPPPAHTGGKWKPAFGGRDSANWSSTRIATPEYEHAEEWEEEHTGGKWKPIMTHDEDEEEDAYMPPPEHTKGKWIPGAKDLTKMDTNKSHNIMDAMALHKQGGSVQYWCGPCNRRLITKAIYQKHLRSNLHLRRTLPEKDLEFSGSSQSTKTKRLIKPSIFLKDDIYDKSNRFVASKRNTDDTVPKKKRVRMPATTMCHVCKQKVRMLMMGKHLISHYHFRRCDMNDETNIVQILDNIHKIVRQSPFQCSPCKFYANWQTDFLNHWRSSSHKLVINRMNGVLWCSFCKFECKSQEDMLEHLTSEDHKDVISVINRSMPLIIRSKEHIACTVCKKSFRYNIQLKRHSKKCPEQSKTFNKYQNRVKCPIKECGKMFKSKISLSWHTELKHGRRVYTCEPCKLEFTSASEAKAHRNFQSHRIKYMEMKKRRGCEIKDLSKACPHCDCPRFKNILHLKAHIEEKHPNDVYSCSTCGMKFALPQDVTWHVRYKKCSFNEQQEGAAKEVWKCRICPYTSPSQAECIFHEVLHNDPVEKLPRDSKYACPVCQKILPKYSLRYHLRQHTQEKPLTCNICAASFTRKSHLGFHMKTVHANRKVEKVSPPKPKIEESGHHQCDKCDAVFAKKYKLYQHMLSNHDHAEFPCEIPDCTFVGVTPSKLKIHSSSHSQKISYVCDKCPYASKTKARLDKHKKTHLKGYGNKLKASGCSYGTNDEVKLDPEVHLQETKSSFYSCRYCDFICDSQDSLMNHMVVHGIYKKENLFDCEYCSPTNTFSTNMKKVFIEHLIKAHETKFPDPNEAELYMVKCLKNYYIDYKMESDTECDDNGQLHIDLTPGQENYIEEHSDLLEEFDAEECYDINESGALVLWEKTNK